MRRRRFEQLNYRSPNSSRFSSSRDFPFVSGKRVAMSQNPTTQIAP